jgi:DNA-binding transcriptional LysR family regulator
MDISALELFSEIARLGSFAAAAKARGMEPSSASRIIANLEASLGFRLFQRSTRKLALSEAGGLYHARVVNLLAGLESAREEARALHEGPSGTLRMTSSVAFGARMIVPLLGEFRALYPAVDFELLFTDDNVDLIEERIDLAARLAPSYRGDVVGVRALTTRYRVVATRGYLAGAPPVARPADLEAHRCLRFSLPPFRGRWRYRATGATDVGEAAVSGDIVISNALALYSAALNGLGPALLPDWLIAGDLARGDLIDIWPGYDWAATDFSTAAWLLYPSRQQLPPKTRVAIDFFRARLGKAREI